jgi:hypothetical protein
MLSAEQLEIRKKRLSATDIGCICGVNPYQSAADVQFSKLYDLDPLEESEAMAVGNMCEPGLVKWGAETLGFTVEYPLPTVIHPKCDLLCCTGDARIIETPAGIEAKTGGIVRGFASREEWGDAGSDLIPEMYRAQVFTQMAVMGWEAVYVPALVAGRGRVLYVVERDNDAIEGILDFAPRWWKKHVIDKEPVTGPDGAPIYPSIETLKRIRRQPKSPREVPAHIVRAAIEAAEIYKRAEARKEQTREALLACIGDGDAAEIGGLVVATFNEINRKGYTVEPTKYRQLRMSKDAAELVAAAETKAEIRGEAA